MALPTFVAAGAGVGLSAAITPALPAGILTNDILLLFLETSDQAITIPTPNGGTWTEVANSPQGGGTTQPSRLTVFWSRYNGTQGNPTTSDSGDHQYGIILAFRGCVASGNPWDVTNGGVVVDGTSQTLTALGNTTTVADCLVLVAWADARDSTSTVRYASWTNADLSDITERADGGTDAGNGGGIGVAEGGKAAASAYGDTTAVYFTGTTNSKGYMTVALKPFVAGAATHPGWNRGWW